GPIVTSISLEDNPAIASYKLFEPKPVRKSDPNFGIDTETYEGKAEFLFQVQLKNDAAAGAVEVKANLRYQACTEKECLPPRKKSDTATLTIAASAPAPPVIPADLIEVPVPAAALPAPTAAPVKQTAAQDQDLIPFLLTALGFGLASIFTP